MKLQLAHRARRFFAAMVPVHISADDVAWVAMILTEREVAAFDRMDKRDRAHSIGVARAVDAELHRVGITTGGTSPEDTDQSVAGDDHRWILAAALLHDVGKSSVRLGTFGRVAATLAGWVAGDDMAPVWAERSGLTRRIGLYLQHAAIGGDILRMAGSDQRVVAWAEEHYHQPEDWTVPVPIGRILAAADSGDL